MADSLENQFLELLLQIKQSGPNQAPFDALNLTPALFAYLAAIQSHPLSTLNDICQLLAITPASASVAIQRLEKENLVQRQSNPQDHRSSIFTLSPEGEKTVQAIQAFRQQKARLLLERLSDQEQLTFLTLFRKLLSTEQEK